MSPNLNSSGPTRKVATVPTSFQLRVPPRKLTPLPSEISRALTFALGALIGVGGCGTKSSSAVHGKVTLDGEPVTKRGKVLG